MDETHTKRRLLFRATHRGTRENDLLLGGFVRAGLDRFNPAELAALARILELPDPDLTLWLTGRAPIPDLQDADMLTRIRDAHAGERA